MAVTRSQIDEALNELEAHKEGFRFQNLAVVLARKRWPELIGSERFKDLGLDAHAPAVLARDQEGKALASSITAKLKKVQEDAAKIVGEEPGVKTLIFYTSGKVTNHAKKKWSVGIQNQFGLELVVVFREDIIASLLDPNNYGLCRSLLRIDLPIQVQSKDVLGRSKAAAEEQIRNWLARSDLGELSPIDLVAIRLGGDGRPVGEPIGLDVIQDDVTRSGRVVLEGAAGAGKSMSLIQLASRQITSEGFAVVVDLPAWVRSGSNMST